ncbi:acyl-CoA dehydrogenase family protein [Mesorhizobium australafricanum]|uniref:Acyl-CoA dehydrogenase family protein n=1 Tax=Mesorhizobium australafricanum TaxID=3072311 RepID=A0ABU4X6J9_9HYPH|nr:acyl-CoA dehydrogenase family protein [Mesorhizobium sp. VK3E]MDX8443583.1 acyl-CoA dehydrogenase family protein [Mesorhizobium sp. VK3E]
MNTNMGKLVQADNAITDSDLELIREVARGFVAKEMTTKTARQAEQGDWTAATGAWKAIAELGWIGLMSPDAYGVDGLPAVAMIADELAMAAFPMPFAETAAFVVPLLAKFNDGSLDDLISSVTSGRELVAIALPAGGLPRNKDECALSSLQANIGGNPWVAEHLARATAVLIPVQDGKGVALALVHRPAAGWGGISNPDLANNAYLTLDWASLAQGEKIVISPDNWTWADLEEAFDVLRTVLAAQVVGLSRAALEMAVSYAKERQAFGASIGSFQAVQQRLADAYMENVAARLLVADAAISRTSASVAMASIQVAEGARKCTFTAQQIWAGMGYTLETDVQLFFRRARARQLLLGSPWQQRESVWHQAAQQKWAV